MNANGSIFPFFVQTLDYLSVYVLPEHIIVCILDAAFIDNLAACFKFTVAIMAHEVKTDKPLGRYRL